MKKKYVIRKVVTCLVYILLESRKMRYPCFILEEEDERRAWSYFMKTNNRKIFLKKYVERFIFAKSKDTANKHLETNEFRGFVIYGIAIR